MGGDGLARRIAILIGAAVMLAAPLAASQAHAQPNETSLARILKKAGASEASCKPAPASDASKAALLTMLQAKRLTIFRGDFFFGVKDGQEVSQKDGTFAIHWPASSAASVSQGVEIRLHTAFGGSDYYFESIVLSTVRNAGKRWYVHNLDAGAKAEEAISGTPLYAPALKDTDIEQFINEPATCSVELKAFDCGGYKAWRIVRSASAGSTCPANPDSAYLFNKSNGTLRGWSTNGIDGLHALFLVRSQEAIASPPERLLKALFDTETIRKNDGKWR